jgi:hypothetical protein
MNWPRCTVLVPAAAGIAGTASHCARSTRTPSKLAHRIFDLTCNCIYPHHSASSTILFIISLTSCRAPRLKPVLLQATSFTVAHSITLGAGDVWGLFSHRRPLLSSSSILFVINANIITDRLNPWRVAVVFGFGLVHAGWLHSVLT